MIFLDNEMIYDKFGVKVDIGNFVKKDNYEGTIKDGKKSGIGQLYFDDKKYCGEFKDDLAHGYGMVYCTEPKKLLYMGNWENDKLVNGEIIYSNIIWYSGEIQNYKPHGFGRMFKNGLVTDEGMWKDGKIQGVYKKEDNGYYFGNIENGKKNGFGIQYEFKLIHLNPISTWLTYTCTAQQLYRKPEKYIQRRVYMGEWKDDLYHGDGILLYDNKYTYKGKFINGKENVGELFYPSGELAYKGKWKNRVFSGLGKLHSLKNTYIGNFQDGKLNGFGVLFNKDNELIYSGLWKNNIMSGIGKLYGFQEYFGEIESIESGYGFEFKNNNLKSECIWEDGHKKFGITYDEDSVYIGDNYKYNKKHKSIREFELEL